MTEKKAKKKRALVSDDSTTVPVNSAEGEVPEHLRRVPPERRLPGGRVLKANGRSYLPGSGNPSHANLPPEAFCTARKTNGQPCRKPKITGADVCGTHGGRAPQVMQKAMARLQNHSNILVQALLTIAMDEEEPTAIRLSAIKEALDRAGIKSKEKLDVAHSMKPWEQMVARATRVRPVSEEPTDPVIIEMRESTGDDRY